jgi:hypothetical protein
MPSCYSLLDGFTKSTAPLVSSPLPFVDPIPLRLAWLFSAWRDDVMSKLFRDFLASCTLLFVWKTQPQVHFWLVDKLSKLQTCLELCRFKQTLLKSWIVRWKVSLPPRVASGLSYNILWCCNYVTTEPISIDIPEAQLTQSLPYSCSVPAPPGCWLRFSCTHLPFCWSIVLMASLAMPWSLSLLWSFHPWKIPSRPCERGIISTTEACLPKDKLLMNKEIPLFQLSWSSFPDRGTMYRFLSLVSPHP